MNIWIDADACPKPVKEILYRVANRKAINVVLVANQRLSVPFSPYIKSLQVEKGFDVADNKIVELAKKNDLVITSDIPLASDVLNKGALVLTPRGEQCTVDTIKERLTMRDFIETMRASGIQSKGSATFSNKEREKFANQLDILLNRTLKKI
ncbi:YaiI/YqxD family protein [Gilliamella mensalis]|uniref:YaiI/YqxD family protein n=1 Tax=Gilliamella mensalis TaxID=1908520 RepID=UPI000A1546B6|nr:YaiI/YqxD family protein [Gilliamella mensalis]